MTNKKKLIEVALPLAAISDASSSEKTLKNSHPANLHVWWARRPLAAARAVLWAALVDDPSASPDRFPTDEDQRLERKRLFDILERLVQWEASNDRNILDEALTEIRSSANPLPTVMDPFAGGGAIPLEAARLGLPAVAGDLNPVAVMVERASLQATARFRDRHAVHPDNQNPLATWSGTRGLAEDVRAYGRQLREAVEELVGSHYREVDLDGPTTATPIAWIWARTVMSPDPAWPGHVPLVRSWVLSKKPNRPVVHIHPIVDEDAQQIRFEVEVGGEVAAPTVSRGNGICLATGATIPADYIKAEAAAGRMGRALLAVAAEGQRRRVYRAPTSADVEAAKAPASAWTPQGRMSDHPQYMGTPRYGLDEWWRLFTDRQLLTLTTFIDQLEELQARIRQDAESAGFAPDSVSFRDGGREALAYAEAVTLFLMLAIDKLADLNNSLTPWEPIAECPRHLFGRQAIQMTWDYAEANPFSHSSGSFDTIMEGVERTIRGPALDGLVGPEPVVEQRDAVALIRSSDKSVLSTDPPYYDNVPYSDLADFFYMWMRRGLASSFPDEMSTLLTPKNEELVADQKRFGSKDGALRHFEDGMKKVFEAVAEHQDPSFPATVFYAFKSAENVDAGRVSTGWATFLASIIDSGFVITSTWPIRTENKSRLRGMKSNALASSVVLSLRLRAHDASLGTRGEFVSQLRQQMPPSVRLMQEENIAPVDLAQSAIGPGMAIFSSYARVVEADGTPMTVTSALALINEILAEVLSGEEAELDADTRFALTWFEQYGHRAAPFGDADTLARAKDTTVQRVAEAGIAESRDGRVRLYARADLQDDWTPERDRRLTVWEMTQYLIRRLESSEPEAAELLRHLGPSLGDRARQLAYLLYGVCERNGWPDEAVAYNMLVTAWPEIARLAAAGSDEPDAALF